MRPRKLGARPLHAGSRGTPRQRACRSEALRRVSFDVAGRQPTSPPGGVGCRAAHVRAGGKVGGGEERIAIRVRPLFQRGVPGPGPASFATAGVYNAFRPMVGAHGRSPTSSFLPVLPVLRCDEPASRGIPRFSPTMGMGSSRRPLPVRCSLRTPSNRMTSCSDFRMENFTSDPTFKNIW